MKFKIIKFVANALGYQLGKQFPNSPVWMLKEKKRKK
jgi:hypothetical protein